MKPGRLEYLAPESLDEAVATKASYDGEAAVLAGGQSLVPMLNFRLARPTALIDLRRVPGLAYVQVADGAVRVGAMTRQRDLELDERVAAACPLLPQALDHVAHTVIRNRGTVGGTIAHADAAAELPTVLAALGGSVRVRGTRGERTIPAEELFLFHLTTALEPDEVLVEVAFPALPPTTGTAFVEVSRRHGDYALVGVAAVAGVGADGRLEDVRLAYAGIAPTPVRGTAAEALLRGAEPGDEAFGAAGETVAADIDAVDEEQATVAYRKHLIRVLTARALRAACARSRESRGDL